jgi:crotonobetainyl-CoA:carnitine CoA-transferase CaiB-like acyl-CoA transferase
MYDAALAWTSIHAGEYWASGHVPDPGRMLLNGRYPCYNVYRCADDRFLSVGAVEQKFWENFCLAVQRPDLVDRRTDEDARADVAALISTRPRDAWVELLERAEACVAPVLDLGEALAHPMARERRMVRDAQLTAGSDETALTLGTAIRIDGRPRPTGTPPPELGADTRALAREVGLTDEQIEALMARGVLRSDGAA